MMRILAALFLTIACAAPAAAADTIADLRHAWAKVYYQMPESRQAAHYPELTRRIQALVAAQPGAPEPLIWKAIIFSSYAKAKGGLGALDLAEAARDAALQAAAIDPKALDAGAYTALGVLYYKVPGWPIGFGNDRKAKDYLDKARAIAPDAIDVNYFTADFLLHEGETEQARGFLERALQAPARPGREDEDAGRRGEIEADLARLAE